MSAPPVITCATARCLISSESPSTGAAIKALAPPESRHTRQPFSGTSAAMSRARRAPTSLAEVANGWPASTSVAGHAHRDGRAGAITTARAMGNGGATAKASYIPAAALPTATTRRAPLRQTPAAATAAATRGISTRGDTASTPAAAMASASARRRASSGAS